MDPSFRESRPIVPRRLTVILAAVLVSTAAFMLFMDLVMDTGMPGWAVPATSLAFAVIILVCAWARLEVECFDDKVTIRYVLKRMDITFSEIIDKKRGDMNEIRNYGSWNLKGVKHMTYAAVGDERGVAMKLAGKRVVVVSCEDADALFDVLPVSNE